MKSGMIEVLAVGVTLCPEHGTAQHENKGNFVQHKPTSPQLLLIKSVINSKSHALVMA